MIRRFQSPPNVMERSIVSLPTLKHKFNFLAGSDIADVGSDQKYLILVPNFSDLTVDLIPHQAVATASAHSQNVTEPNLSHA